MSKGITNFKSNKCPQAYKLKRDKMPIIPFLSLSSEGVIRLQRIYNFSFLHPILSTVLDIIGLYYPLLYYFWD